MTIAVALAGLLLGICLVAYYGFGAVTTALLAVGWGGFAVLVCYQLGLYGLLGLAWFAILPHRSRHALAACIWSRMIRDAGSEILPLSQLGGLIMGARAATLLGLPATLAFASTVTDVTLELVAQFAFTAAGLGLLIRWQPASPFLVPALVALALAGLAISGFIAVQLIGFGPIEQLARRLAARLIPAAAAGNVSVQDGIRAIYRRRGGLLLGILLHFLVWIVNGIGAWIALRFMGIAIGPEAVLVIESLLYAIRSVAFAVPNAVGVQEGAYVMLGAVFGLDPETVLALSLLKRARDGVIGVPTLLIWQAAEGARLRERRPPAA